MATKDQIEGTTSPNTLKSGICGSNGNPQSETLKLMNFTPKVRKPYTITKQREKWTEEEHQKFLEAFRLYGRGWRQIEEHVGTKTAVQIRSHAQKFFSKVVRESNGGFESSIKSIEIPPPRPKRKPLHPYPRKYVDSLKGISPSSKPERSPFPYRFVTEQDKKLPSSVLSAFVFDAVRSAASEQQNRCPSLTSCTTNAQSLNTSLIEDENNYPTSREKEKASLSSVKVFGHSEVEDILSVESNADFEDPLCAKGNAAVVVPFTSIKLFGKTVKVKDSGKPSSAENFQSQTLKHGLEGNDAVDEMLVQALPSTCSEKHLSLGTAVDNWTTIPSKANLSPYMEIHPDKNNHVGYTSDAPLPWWAFYRGLPVYYITSFNQTHKDSCVEEKMKEKEILNERSCTGSNTSSVTQTENREKISDSVDSQCQNPRPEGKMTTSVDSQCQNPRPEGKMTTRKSSEGFVPYKRCLAQRDMSSSVVAYQERERQKARVCSWLQMARVLVGGRHSRRVADGSLSSVVQRVYGSGVRNGPA